MKIYYADEHRLQDAPYEYIRGRQLPSFEAPVRGELVRKAIAAAGIGPIGAPDTLDRAAIERAHDAEFLTFLETFWAQWSEEVGDIPALPNTWLPPRGRWCGSTRPGAALGRFCVDMSSPILSGTWEAALAAVGCAQSAAREALRSGSAFALCRPPGHHAGRDYFGGYCFLNNVACAVETLRGQGLSRVAVLDVDYHHGNGTQDIFYARDDVLVVSLHADPRYEYPYYLGFTDEVGEGPGRGFNLNLPMPFETAYDVYGPTLARGLEAVAGFAPDAVLVSLGVDTSAQDPISRFRLQGEDFREMGRAIAGLGLPTAFVMEGGYATETIGANVVAVLEGFETVRAAAQKS